MSETQQIGKFDLIPTRSVNVVKSGAKSVHPECKNCIFAKRAVQKYNFCTPPPA